ncbi:hypothetical protein D3C71_1789520 [compost metagenome]
MLTPSLAEKKNETTAKTDRSRCHAGKRVLSAAQGAPGARDHGSLAGFAHPGTGRLAFLVQR